MLTKKFLITLATAGLTTLSATHGWAAMLTATNDASTSTSTTTTTTTSKSSSGVAGDALVSRYTKLVGSQANAQSLVTGLRTGSVVTLAASGGAPAVSFTPATPKMGYGNINIAISLAKTTLTKQGITNPTPAQLAAALNGGSITLTNGAVVVMPGVLTQRSAGMGWGKIAKTMDVKLGTVVSASKSDKAGKKDSVAKTGDDSRNERDVKVEKAEKAEKADKKEMLAKAETSKNHSSTSDGGTSHAKGSSSSNSSNNSNSGGSKSSGGGSSNGGGGNSGGGNGNSGGGGGGKK
jgi:hypothetical protein